MKRITKQRQAIFACLKEAKRPLSIEEILTSVSQKVAQINLATVYRNLKILLQENQIAAVNLPGNTTRYEFISLDHRHHHHFLCLQCNSLYDVIGCPRGMEDLVPKNFRMISHNITLNGLCATCGP